MQCSKCQAAIAKGAKFCPKCGVPVAPPVEATGKRCPQCGTENPANAKFCRKDGYRLDAEADKPDTPDTPASHAPVVMPLAEPKVQEDLSNPTSPARNTVTCPKCGTVNSSTAKFCKKDGYSLQATGAATPPKTAPMLPQAPSAIQTTKQAKIDADISQSVPPVVPQTTPGKQSAPVVPRPVANTAPSSKTLVNATAAKPSRVLAIGLAVGLVILASAGGGYAYWAGYVGNRQGNVQDEINAELGSHGLSNVKVTVNRDWGASLSGMVLNQVDKDKALALLKGHTELKQLVDTVQIESSSADVEKSLNKALSEAGFSSPPTVQLDQDLMATLHGSADSQEEKDRMLALVKSVAGVTGVRDEIEVTAPETIPEAEYPDLAEVAPEPPAPLTQPPQALPQRAVDRAALESELNARLRANGVRGVTGHVNPDMSVALSGTVRSADERYRALSIGGSLPGANGVRETIQIATPQIVKLAPPQAQPPQVSPLQAPSPQAAAIDPAKLEGEINRAFRSRDINSVTAQVNDDMSLTLKGSASAAEKERALQFARQVRGIRGIKDKIFVIE